MLSPTFSFTGFKLSKNMWSAIKNALYVLVPAIITELAAHNMIANGVAAVVGPMILKAIEFWTGDVEIK